MLIALAVVIVVAAHLLKIKLSYRLWIRLLLPILFVLAIFFMIHFLFYNENFMLSCGWIDKTNMSDSYYYNTFYTQFIIETEYFFPKKPTNYSEATMMQIADVISSYGNETDERVDIIAIQVESWQMLDQYDVQLSEDVFANYHRLANEGITGFMISPKYGGGTADIEYEAFTGFTSNDTESITTPFNINMHSNFPGLIRTLKSNGYGAFSVHSYTNYLYNRKNAYPMLGFDESYFSDSFVDPIMSGPWISEQSCIEKMIEVYEKEVPNHDHVFVYGLTMQNHTPCGGRYPEEDLVGVTSPVLSDEDILTLRNYATILKDIDSSIGYLTDYLSTLDRKVILVVWGDHQTDAKETDESDAVLSHTPFYQTYDEEKDFYKLHTTPYLVWTNYDRSNDGTSLGYLAPNRILAQSLNAYNVLIPSYWHYFIGEEKSYKGVTANYLITFDDQILFEKSPAQLEEYSTRKLIQYDVIRGKQYLDPYLD
ncbi:MAG: LTA synthase family protein [Oscillospiraceae bacterium]|nr:LTA synthase family protein [Oscillospiraceae bacterium]